MTEIRMPEIIEKKRDGCTLTDDEVQQFVTGVVSGQVTAAQTGAMLMAIFLKGLDDAETATLTLSMLRSGRMFIWPTEWKGKVVDKHSIGGVGEKTSLVLTPALVACGLKVPMISGRGLAHTGGTLDKLEAIPGFCVSFTMEQMEEKLKSVGGFIVGATKDMVPADRELYAIRDVTATVANTSLIAASIMSKKFAESLDALVILVAFGTGSFMKTEQEARALCRILNDIGRRQGVHSSCLLIEMDHPLGRTVGNALEVREAVRCLNGDGPDDLHNVVCDLGAKLLMLSNRAKSLAEGKDAISKVLKDGSAREMFINIITAQGADRAVAEKMFTKDGGNILPHSCRITTLKANSTGYVHRLDALDCGRLAHMLGAGRTRPEDKLNLGAGLELAVTVGDSINKDDPWITIHHDAALTSHQLALITSAITISTDAPPAEKAERIVGFVD